MRPFFYPGFDIRAFTIPLGYQATRVTIAGKTINTGYTYPLGHLATTIISKTRASGTWLTANSLHLQGLRENQFHASQCSVMDFKSSFNHSW